MNDLKATREQLYAAIERERDYQERKWPSNGKPLDIYGRMIVAYEELQEARLAYCKHTSNDETLRELLQVVVVCVRALRNLSISEIEDLPILEFETGATLPQWLERLENQFVLARMDEGNVSGLAFIRRNTIAAMGMRALVEHGVVERESFELPSRDEEEQPMKSQEAAYLDYLEILEKCNTKNPSARVLNPDVTRRGFFVLSFRDGAHQQCSLQKASDLSPNEDAIWLGLDDHTRMLLTRQDVQALLPFLIRFAETGEPDVL